ncbi:MAG: carbonic anhydrase [Deltaproteobacteria bacterium]|nr:carbonic anhydrase [Deltaproteobacteria bacterium]
MITETPLPPLVEETLQRLMEGNRRFVSGAPNSSALSSPQRRSELTQSQAPFAVVLGCSDSRVPAEIVFDQGLGDLFVIRVAGNVVTPTQIGSIEFAVAEFATPLVVVLGHSRCGAVQATLSQLNNPQQPLSPSLRALIRCLQPAVEPLLEADWAEDPEALLTAAVQANIRASVEALPRESEIIEGRIASGELVVMGAEYSLETGLVDFFR